MPPTRRENQPWYASVNLDFFVTMCNKTIFQPFLCWLLPLCLRAGETPWTEPAMQNTIIWACLMTAKWVLMSVSDRIAYGLPREVDSEEEVIVITGGSSGLGRCIAEVYAMKGGSVAVLDRKQADPDMVLENVEYYDCDISDRKNVERCWKQINKDLGTPTILINNAGVVIGKKLLDLKAEEVHETFHTNVISQYHLNQLFLAPLREHERGGTLVTISSVLGRLGASQLSDYTASKAAETAMHQSLEAELAPYPNIKTILVAPGQLSTEMFGDLKPGVVANFFGPVVEVSELAIKIVQLVNAGRGGFIAEPFYSRWIGLLDVLPPGFQKVVRKMARLDTAMETFRTREGAKVREQKKGGKKGAKGKKGEESSEESVELL